jgi:putative hemolysin
VITHASAADPWKTTLERLPVPAVLHPLIVPPKIRRLYAHAASVAPEGFIRSLLDAMNVETLVSATDLARIPHQGPLVVVANHPFGLLEGLVLARLLDRVRPDVRILANSLLGVLPELKPRLIMVDPFGARHSVQANTQGVREVLNWLGGGGAMLSFPAGEVSHFDFRQRAITDPEWNAKIVRFARHTRATVLPMYVKGANSLTFQLMGMLNAGLRTARLLHELANKEHCRVEVRVGSPVTWEDLQTQGSDDEATRYLRYRTYLLGQRRPSQLPNEADGPKASCAIAPAASKSDIEMEIAALAPDQRLAESGDLQVFVADAGQIPAGLAEIGRLREIAFRAAGEGTGRDQDLDAFDAYYQHLFIWSRKEHQILGAYRLASTREVLRRHGVGGLYTSTLFEYREEFFERMGPAIELGRSFVVPEWQKHYAPLLLLWKGIATVIARRPDHPILFGAVSISNEYQPVSRRLMVRYLEAHQRCADLAGLVRPRRPFDAVRRGSDNESISLMLRSVEELSSVTADIEPDGKGIPILLKQYLRLGGKLLGFSVDASFSNTLDGLIVVDLRRTPAPILQRYLGKEGAATFAAVHRL